MIRDAVEADAEAIALLSTHLGYPAGPVDIRDRLKTIRDRGDGQVFVAEDRGRVVGWLHVLGVHILESAAHAEIAGLVVDEGHRGRGMGSDLVAAAERWAATMGYPVLRVRSNVIREAAHRLYRRLGYAELKRQAVFAKSVAVERDRREAPPGA